MTHTKMVWRRKRCMGQRVVHKIYRKKIQHKPTIDIHMHCWMRNKVRKKHSNNSYRLKLHKVKRQTKATNTNNNYGENTINNRKKPDAQQMSCWSRILISTTSLLFSPTRFSASCCCWVLFLSLSCVFLVLFLPLRLSLIYLSTLHNFNF